MPRYDDRLDNVLDLLRSDEHTNSDTIFRQISDILIQENPDLDGPRRATVVRHLAEMYPKTTQPARMEVMDIAARASGTAPELVAIAAADRSILGTRIWDRVLLPSDDWQSLLPKLPKSVLGRLRARMDLPDDIVVRIDREWRDRIKNVAHRTPTLEETIASLTAIDEQAISGTENEDLVPQSEEALFADVEQQLDDEADALDLTQIVDEADTQTPAEEKQDASFDTIIARSGSALMNKTSATDVSADEIADEEDTPEIQSIDADVPSSSIVFMAVEGDGIEGEKDIDAEEDDRLIDLTDVLSSTPQESETDEENAQIKEDSKDTEEEDSEDDLTADEAFALGEKPQVEDPKIQDILERLREFGSRSRSAPAPSVSANSDNMSADESPVEPERTAALFDLSSGDQPAEPAEPEGEDADLPPAIEPRSGASLFLPEQPEEEADSPSEDDMLEPIMFDSEAGFQPLSVNGTTWVTDRFGTIAEFHCDKDEAFGVMTDTLEGQILSSLFDAAGQRSLDRVLHARRAFRDKSLNSAKDNRLWMVSGVPVFDEDSGIFLGHRGTATGLSIAQQTAANEEDAMESVNAQALETDAVDVASLAHELKTPLNAIRGFAEMIETQQLGPASAFARHRSQRISQEADQLHHILSDLLLTKGGSNGEPPKQHGLQSSISEALSPFDPHLDISGLAALDPDIKTTMDTALLHSALEKMLHNCALWTPASRAIALDVVVDDAATASVQMKAIGWMGGSGRDDLHALSKGPRLSYRHPLLEKSYQGRGLTAILEPIKQAGGRLYIRAAGRMDAALVLILPVKAPS